MSSSNIILNHQQIQQKVNRIAYQIYEDHYDQKEIIMAGIADNGYVFAKMLKSKIESVSSIQIQLIELKINKKNPIQSKVDIALSQEELKNKAVVVVDDVLNSGKTLMYGLQCFLEVPLKRLCVAVLVNRSHKRFPVNADYVGMSLATTLKEHIEVSFENPKAHSASLS